MRKRILAFFLTLCIVLSMLPIMAFAEEVGGEETTVTKSFSELLGDSETTQITMTQDEMVVTTINKSVTIDLDGNTLKGTIMVAEGCTVTIKDSKVSGSVEADFVVSSTDALVIVSAGAITEKLVPYVSNTSKITGLKIEEAATEEILYKVGEETFVRWADAVAAGNNITVIQNAALTEVVKTDLYITVAEGKTFDLGNIALENATLTVKSGNVKLAGVVATGESKVVMEGADVKMMQAEVPNALAENLVIKAGYYAFDASAFLADGLMQLGGLVAAIVDNAVAYVGTTGYTTLADAIAAANGGKTIVLVKAVDTTLNIATGVNVVLELNGYSFTSDATILNYGTIIVKNELGASATVTKLINMGTATLKSGVFSSVENGGTLKITDAAVINTMSNTGDLQISGGKFAAAVAATLKYPSDFVDNYYLGAEDETGYVPVVTYDAFIVNGENVTFVPNADDVWANADLVDGSVVYLFANADSFTLNVSVELVLANGVVVTNATVAAGETLTVPYGTTKYTYGAGVYAEIKAPVAQIGDVYYMTIQDAIAAVQAGEVITLVGEAGATVTLEGYIHVEGKKNFTLDLNGMNVAFNTEKANVIVVNDSSTLVVKNGTINGNVSTIGYFTFDAVTVNGTVTVTRCTVDFTNGSSINAPEGGVALAIKTTVKFAAYQPAVVFDATTVAVNGDITVDADAVEVDIVMSLTIAGGTFSGEVLVGAGAEDATVAISGGTFTGIENYEAFYLFCRAADKYPELEEDGSYTVADEVEYAASVVTGKDRVEVSYYTVEAAVEAALAAEGTATITLQDHYDGVLVINGATQNITLNLGKYNVEGIEYTSVVGEDGSFNTLTITANHSGTRAIKGTIVVNAGKVVLDSAKLNVNVKTDAVLLLNAANAFATITNVNVTKCGAIAEYAEGVEITNLSISGGTFPVKPAYENVVDSCVIEEGSKNWTVKLSNPTAAVYDADGFEIARYATFAEAVEAVLANADLAKQIRILKNDPFAEYVLDLPAGVEILVINEVGADVTVVVDNDTFTRFDAATGVYSGYTTFAIVNGNVYCKDQAEVTEAVKAGGATVAITNNIDALTLDGALVTKLTVAKGKTIEALTVAEGRALLVVTDEAELSYNPGVYNNLVYAAYIAKNVYATIDDAIATGSASINVAVDGPFTVTEGTVTLVFGDTTTVYGLGEYENLADADAKVDNVLYATVEDAVEAANATTDSLSVYLLRDVEAVLLNVTTHYVYLYGEGKTIGALGVTGNKRVSVANANVGTIEETLAATFILNDVTVEAVASTAAALYLRGTTTVGSLELQNANLFVDQDEAVSILSLALEGNIGLTVNASLTVGELALAEELTFTTAAITGGNFYMASADLLKDALAENYAFTKCIDEAGTVYYQAINAEKVVAVVDGVLYTDLAAAVVDAFELNVPVVLVKTVYTLIRLDATVNKLVLVLEEGVFYKDNYVGVINTNEAYIQVVVDEETGAKTFTYHTLVAKVGDTNYDSIQAAIDAAQGEVVTILVDGTFTVAEGSHAFVEIDGKVWALPSGEYDSAAELTAVASTGSKSKGTLVYYIDLPTAMAANSSVKTTITLLADVADLVVNSGSYTFAMGGFTITTMNVNGATVGFSGTGVIGALNVGTDSTVTLGASTLTVMELHAMGGKTTVTAVTVPAALEANDFLVLNAAAYVVNEDETITYYSNLTSIKAGTAVMLKDQTKAITVKYDITIDLNGYTLAGITVADNKVVTLTGNGNVGTIVANGTLQIASTDLLFAEDPSFTTVFVMENADTFCVKFDETIEGDYQYAFAEAEASYWGQGYATFMDAYTAAQNNSGEFIVLYKDVIVDETLYLCFVGIDLNGHTLTSNGIYVWEAAAIFNGTVLTNVNDTNAVIWVTESAYLDLGNVTVGQAKYYDYVTGVNASVILENHARIYGYTTTIPVLLATGSDVCIEFADDCVIGKTAAHFAGAFCCHNHKLANGKCAFCGEVAKALTVVEGVTVYDEEGNALEPVNGAYLLFKGDVVFLKHGAITAGYSFNGWILDTTATDHVQQGSMIVIGSADIAVTMDLVANEKVNVTINAPLFNVTGLAGVQLGAATVTPNAGVTITVTYAGAEFMTDSAVVYWVNENGMIVGKGNELTFTASTATTITAICDQGNAESALVVFRNGTDKVGSKVVSYISVTAADVANLLLPANATVGSLNVVGWKIAGSNEVLSTEAYHAAVEAAIANGTVLYLEPAIAKTTVDVNLVHNPGDEAHTVVTVFAGEYAYITAPALEGLYFAYWIVNGEVFYGDTLVYKFDEATEVVTVYFVDESNIYFDPTVRVESETDREAGKIYINGVYQVPEGYTLTDAGIVYTTVADSATLENLVIDGENVKVKKVSGLNGKDNVTYNLTLSTSKSEVTVFARAFMTYVDEDNHIITVYTDIEVVIYLAPGL